MSKTTVIYPIIACLEEAKGFIKTDSEWNSINEDQDNLMERHYNVEDLEKIKDIIDSIATEDHQELLKFFADRGFEFQIEPFKRGEFGAGSVMSVLVEWLTKHKEQPLYVGNKKYDGVLTKEDYSVFNSDKHTYPVVMLDTKSDEKVYMTIADKEYSSLELAARIKEISKNLEPNYEYENVIFPMVDLDQDVDISWILGLNIDDNGDNWKVVSAQQKTRFKMNHIGAKAESAVSMVFRCSSVLKSNPPVVIDKPFFVWMTRPGIKDPLFIGYISEEDWKNPGDFHEREE